MWDWEGSSEVEEITGEGRVALGELRIAFGFEDGGGLWELGAGGFCGCFCCLCGFGGEGGKGGLLCCAGGFFLFGLPPLFPCSAPPKGLGYALMRA
jgi:hypothetical protein